MKLSHHSRRGPAGDHQDQGGYVLPMLGLLLVPLLLIVGLSIDVGSWYNRASDIQKAADAAALAGVVWLPREDLADDYAREAAERNGFVHGVDGIEVGVEPVGDKQLRVTIRDTRVKSYLYGALTNRGTELQRDATAQYVLPVPLGSPKNILGTGDLYSGSHRENFWLAVSGACASRENGDLRLAANTGNYHGEWRSMFMSGLGTRYYHGYSCEGTETNQAYRSSGYAYAIQVPQSGTYQVQAYDATYQRQSLSGCTTITPSDAGDSHNVWVSTSTSNACNRLSDQASVTTTFTLRGPDATPLSWTDNPVINSETVLTNDSYYANRWRTMGTIVAPGPGTYYLQVSTPELLSSGDRSWASNSFGLRVTGSGFSTPCTKLLGQPGYSAACPQIHGLEDMSILANLSGTQATFYLAEVDDEHRGKTLEIDLFDPGEGAQTLEILDPDGDPVHFSWSAQCATSGWPSHDCEGEGTQLEMEADDSYQGPDRGSRWNFSDRTVRLTIPIPNDYDGGWWRVRYTVGSSPTDRTTWSARIIGDPVHLVED